MSSTKRRRAKRDRKIRIILTGFLLAGVMVVMIWGIKDFLEQGFSGRCFLFGVPIVILFYCAGNIISPVFREWNEQGRMARAKLKNNS